MKPKINLIIFSLFLYSYTFIFSQENKVGILKTIYLSGVGEDVDIWCQKENVYFEFNDTTLIKFTESSTFEKRVTFPKPFILTDKTYRILIKNSNDSLLHITKFTIDQIEDNSLAINNEFRRCCRNRNVKYIFFKRENSIPVDTYCDKYSDLKEYANNFTGKIKLVGIINDSITKEIAQERIIFMMNELQRFGITKESIISEFENNYKSFTYGSEYLLFYPEEYPYQDLGVILYFL